MNTIDNFAGTIHRDATVLSRELAMETDDQVIYKTLLQWTTKVAGEIRKLQAGD